jgi:hypothetical protein
MESSKVTIRGETEKFHQYLAAQRKRGTPFTTVP